ncbi:MAG: hypothetical protein AAB723_03420, partial [Patescibacteria group bacterium]
MRFFSKKYLKAPMALLVCLVLVLQMLPAPQPAQAGFWDVIKKIVRGIGKPPNVTFTNDGRIKAGEWETDQLFGGQNPFSKISLGGGGLPLIDSATGQPAGYCWEALSCDTSQGQVARVKSNGKNECCIMGKPIIPEECELGIKYPGDDLCAASCDEKRTPNLREACRELCNQEKIAHRQACTHFIRLQKAAADLAFLAKKIYNSTNPLDDCFFLKNCKSNCLLRYGEVKYVITWLDIAQFLLPTAWITVIKQVMGVIAALGKIKDAYMALSSLLTDGLKLISGFFETFSYLKTMFVALENIGGTMSAGIGVASVAAS